MLIARRFRPLSAGGLLIALLTISAPAVAAIDDPKPSRPDTTERFQPKEVSFTATVEPSKARPGEVVTFAITAKVEDSWHIYAHAEDIPEGVSVLPTRFEFFANGGLEPADDQGWVSSERPKDSDPDSAVLSLPYHEGTVSWKQSLRVPDDAPPGEVSLQTQVFFQLCTDTLCKPPTRRTVTASPLTIVADDSQALQARPDVSLLAGLFGPLLVPQVQDDASPEIRDTPARFQPEEASFTTSIEPTEARPGETVNYQVHVKLAPTWHIYGYGETIPEGGAGVPTSFDLFGLDGLERAGEWTASEEPHEPVGDSAVLVLPYHEDEVTWTLPMRVPADASPGPRSVRTQIQFQVCDPKMCKPMARVTLPPVSLTVLEGDGSVPAAASTGASATPDEPSSVEAEGDSAGEALSTGSGVATGELAEKIDQGLLAFMGWSALGGLVALMMPCVWPIVPITVNFFVKQGQLRKDRSTTGLAVAYCLAIIGIFTLMGVLFSAFFGAASLSQLANAAWLNLLVAGLFIVFGLSLLGVFEIRLPTFLLNASAQGEARGGMIGVMFMALTLTITSFTCTFPVVGALLVLAAGGSYLYPVIGLATFATVLALPFFLLALAPGLMQSMPRSGDWMNAVKIVGGLVEIGAAFKFLNTAEISMGANPQDAWLDAQVLLAVWVIIAAVCGLYLLGIFKTSHDHGEVQIGAGRLLFGTFFLGLALYFSPALFGYPPKSKIYDRVVVGLLPADADEMDILVQMQKLGLSGGGGGSAGGMMVADADETDPVRRARSFHGVWWGLSYEAALEQAKATGKPILIDFTGVNCANCRLMEKSVLPRPEVVQRLEQFIPLQLYTDRVPVDGLTPEEKFNLAEENLILEVELTNQQVSPLYVVLTADSQLVVPPRGGYIDPAEFVAYLDRALSAYADRAPQTADAGE